MKALALVVFGVLLLAPSAGADGVTWHVVSGTPGDNGWYRSAVTIHVDSGPAPCAGKDFTFQTSSDAVTCTGTGGTVTLQFKIDGDPPTVSGGAAARGPDQSGWYNHPVDVAFSGSDSNSGIASCTTATYAGPDSGSGAVTGTCKDVAGNVSAPSTFKLQYDATPPSVTGATARAADSGAWFNHAVGVSFSGTDAASGVASCTGSTTYSGPDTKSATLSGTCTDKAGNSASASLALQYDATPPAVTAKPARPPDDHDWYTKPVAVAFAATDATSGVDSCSPATTYSGPDDAAAKVAGTCHDAAGNAATATQTLRYDATAPRLSDVSVNIADGSAVVSWRQPADTAKVAVSRTPGRDGAASSVVYTGRATRFKDGAVRSGVAYRYTLTSTDDAGNRWSTMVKATLRALFAPVPGAAVKPGARLAWTPVKGASYYNVQLFRGGHKIMTVWPVRPELRLVRSWRFDGKRQTLRAGRYTWYVWPGHGPRTRAKYGALVGSNWFVVK